MRGWWEEGDRLESTESAESGAEGRRIDGSCSRSSGHCDRSSCCDGSGHGERLREGLSDLEELELSPK